MVSESENKNTPNVKNTVIQGLVAAWPIWFDLIPASILSALLLPELVTSGVPRNLVLFQPKLLVAIPTFLFAMRTKSLGGTVIVGMMLFWLSGKLL
jgi:branched-subunit amino acid transport protein